MHTGSTHRAPEQEDDAGLGAEEDTLLQAPPTRPRKTAHREAPAVESRVQAVLECHPFIQGYQFDTEQSLWCEVSGAGAALSPVLCILPSLSELWFRRASPSHSHD